MARSGKLKAALESHKGVNHKLERQKKLRKDAEKKKQPAVEDVEDNLVEDSDEEEEGGVPLDFDDEEGEEPQLDIARIDDTDSSADDDDDDEGIEHVEDPTTNEEEDVAEDEDQDDIPFSDIASLNSEDRGDIIPFQRLTINNHAALTASLARIALPISSHPFSLHQTITSAAPVVIKDIDDDLNRELEFYAQSLAAVKEAKKKLKGEGISFSRPSDYFAEMVKSEEHMGRIRQRLVDDAAGKKAASDARRQRDLKKFGKAVQVAKQQERDKSKRDTLDKIKVMKRKRSGALPTDEKESDMFDIALDSETKRQKTSSSTFTNGDSKGKTNFKRQSKNEKFGFGGKKRHAKSNDAMSSAGIGLNRKAGGKKRLGKDRRAKGRA